MSIIFKENEETAILQLYRENGYNALDYETFLQLHDSLIKIKESDSYKTVIITGSGSIAFTAGADLKERINMGPQEVQDYLDKARQTYREIESLPQPVISAVNGLCIGGGLEMSLACDLRIAASHSLFSLPEVKIGIIPGVGGTQRLLRAVGELHAKELIFTGKKITAERALSIGLISEVVEGRPVLERALEIAEEINQNAPLSLKESKAAINFGRSVTLEEGLFYEAEAYGRVLNTEDRNEALAAFREKRKPVFKGR
ncbi:enoyl-CoA hydratase/isomerase family protein [Bacillus sp. ISL-47]|uniref:enoyl-CoA hydratase/isomerase family protein n=1 Tax=Bacillus sp. ISL-47 TaxID=2819130 RepID=UPI001BEC50BA|nr:enoyl-CoA hydratase-related protein [Bacillus sp. ISL-47]MBT2689803.1 enoyl-CoA hydratase/isomerase family protein [Bacillus sp. ISL-47]MBT2709251.1 enoyl-CoA hydratase/isomerase family protein [Pseudomonas sp. ISL-84]